MSYEVGDECIYRERTYGPSERVKIIEIYQVKQSFRAEIEFLDDGQVGVRKTVLGNRLRGLWCEVEAFDQLMANWQSLEVFKVTDVEECGIETVFNLLVPTSVATWEWNPIKFATTVHDAEALRQFTGIATSELISSISWFELNGELVLSLEGTLLIAERACRQDPMPILEWVIQDEKVKREECKRGGFRLSNRRENDKTSPEWEYEMYLKYAKPLHELLREWCGHRPVSLQERLGAAEAETHRLDVLVARLVDVLKGKGDEIFAVHMEEEHERERITPERFRPIVDRPLRPDEIPVRYVRAERRWGN